MRGRFRARQPLFVAQVWYGDQAPATNFAAAVGAAAYLPGPCGRGPLFACSSRPVFLVVPDTFVFGAADLARQDGVTDAAVSVSDTPFTTDAVARFLGPAARVPRACPVALAGLLRRRGPGAPAA